MACVEKPRLQAPKNGGLLPLPKKRHIPPFFPSPIQAPVADLL